MPFQTEGIDGWDATWPHKHGTYSKRKWNGSKGEVFPENDGVHHRLHRCSPLQVPDFRKWPWKSLNHIPVEPVFPQECKYGFNFIYQSIYSKNRRKRIKASQLQFTRTRTIRKETQFYKLIHDPWAIIYDNHNIILHLVSIEY